VEDDGVMQTTDTLGGMLRVWRDRRHPADVGMTSGPRRRAAGLRREELAELASLSVDYVVRLEQGRATSPSPQVAAALSRALQLRDDERDLLYRLAGLLPPGHGAIERHLAPGLQRLLSRLGDLALGVYSADWTLISWTPLFAALLGDPAALPLERRNLLRSRFLPESAPQRDDTHVWSIGGVRIRHEPGGLKEFDAAVVGDLRRTAAEHPSDPVIKALVDELNIGSAHFAQLWSSGAVGTHAESRKTIEHATAGDVKVDCDVLAVPGSGQHVVAYTAATGSVAADRLDFVRATAGLALSLPSVD
jgi:transcriptional regulator with XRE-family HTH domain